MKYFLVIYSHVVQAKFTCRNAGEAKHSWEKDPSYWEATQPFVYMEADLSLYGQTRRGDKFKWTLDQGTSTRRAH